MLRDCCLVQWGDMDAFGHISSATYFRYLENGRFAYYKAIEGLLEQISRGMSPVALIWGALAAC